MHLLLEKTDGLINILFSVLGLIQKPFQKIMSSSMDAKSKKKKTFYLQNKGVNNTNLAKPCLFYKCTATALSGLAENSISTLA